MGSIGITTGLKALLAAQFSLQTAGHNIANANVEGYSRQSVLLSTDIPVSFPGVGFIGTGVKTDGIVRTTDELLERRIQVQNRGLGRLMKESTILSQVEDYFKEPAEGSLSSLFSNFFSALNDMTLDPTDSTLRADVVMAGQILCDGFNTVSKKLDDYEGDLEKEIETRLETVNQLAKEIHEVTDKIAVTLSSKQQANELYDKRNLLLKELNSLVDAEVVDGEGGQISVLVGGRILASHGYHTEIEMDKDENDEVFLHLKNDNSALNVKDGEIKELLYQRNTFLRDLGDKMDTLAGQMLFEFNRIHSTGLPLSGPFSYLQGEYRVKDLNYDGVVGNEILSESGVPFPPKAGSLYVTVSNEQTGELEQTEVKVNPATQSLLGLAQTLAQIPHLNAYVDSQGRLNIAAGSGYAFDFATRLDPAPDKDGTFGNRAAMISGSASYPVTLNPGDTLLITEDGVPQPLVTFAGGTYTADEIATEIDNQTGKDLASVVDGRLVIKSTTSGSTSTLQISDVAGTPASVLGLSTALETGADLGVSISLEGKYTGSSNTSFRFEPMGTGTIGVTPNLSVAVYNDMGDQIAILNVGESYSPGDYIDVADGVEVSFTSGDISDTSGDFFTATMIADSDTANILASLGLNTFFNGESAQDIQVREEIVDSPSLISAAQSDKEGDNLNVLRLADLADTALEGLNDNAIVDYYSGVIGQLGLQKELADDLLDVQQMMMTNLENQRASVSGVSIDEELLNLDKFQQMLEAATRFLQVNHEVMDTLINLT